MIHGNRPWGETMAVDFSGLQTTFMEVRQDE